jgi:hypothetical protein
MFLPDSDSIGRSRSTPAAQPPEIGFEITGGRRGLWTGRIAKVRR